MVTGFIIEYAQDRKYDLDIFSPNDHQKYIEFYKHLYTFNVVSIFIPENYDMVVVLSDDDWSYKSEWVIPKTVCIDHFYQIRNRHILHHIPVGPFISQIYQENFIIPIHIIIPITHKNELSKVDCVHIAILGRDIPVSPDELSFIKCGKKPIFHIVNQWGIHPSLRNIDNIKLYENIDALALNNIIANCQYIYISDKNINHNEGYSISASVLIAFSTLCQLIIPVKMNKHLRLKSAIIYNKGEDIVLPVKPDYNIINKEREYFIDIRNKILDNFLNK
jgi:hypothetical protein